MLTVSSEFRCSSVPSVNSVAKDIHIIIGTKAQFIKMAPVMKGLESRGVTYNFINLGQHGETVERLRKQFRVRSSEVQSSEADIISLPGMLKWAADLLFVIVFKKKYLKDKIFKGQGGVALIHGDTLSTLIGLFMAKRAGLKVAHVESGLRSWNYFHPFPEELIRVICMRFSDFLFAPSDEAVENLKKMSVKGKIFNTGGNTGMDAVKIVQSSEFGVNPPQSTLNLRGEVKGGYVIVSIHRFENLYSRKRFRFILDTVDEVSKRFNVVFVMHGPTEKKLSSEFGVRSSEFINSKLKTLNSKRVVYLPLQDYPTFLRLVKDAEFVITDGGSVQEECYYLGKPCLIMRKRTERNDGIGENAVLAAFNSDITREFVEDYKKYERPELYTGIRPSDILIEEVLRL